uniref:Regulatory protein zeste n=1 Tax=Timema californicum TaxID=61474 RepID=A0A7R9JEA9_TIMCA|nr:unnamed protein product [Timema californicum]
MSITRFAEDRHLLQVLARLQSFLLNMSAKRFVPYMSKEKAVLLDLVHRYKNIFGNKKTDATSNSEKKEALKNIAKEYNSNYNVSKRDETQLKRCWEKFKYQVRKQKQLER